jgi:hypothetical protein
VGLKLLGEEGIYESCLTGLKIRGLGRRRWVKWVEDVVMRFVIFKMKERGLADEIFRELGGPRNDDMISTFLG